MPFAKTTLKISLCAALVASGGRAARAGGTSLIDHRIAQDTSGVWNLAASPGFPAALSAITAGAALWEGGNDRLGKALWQSLDAGAVAGVSTLALKYTFQRERPSQTNDPNEWFKGPRSQSFPSGDVSATTALVTPLIWEYHADHPSIYLLGALPLFDMEARMKARAHWQTDVLAGAAVGVLSGYLARRFKNPLILSIMPGGVAVGLRHRF